MIDELDYKCPACSGTTKQRYQKCSMKICWTFVHKCSYPNKQNECEKNYQFQYLECSLCSGTGKITWLQRIFLNERLYNM